MYVLHYYLCFTLLLLLQTEIVFIRRAPICSISSAGAGGEADGLGLRPLACAGRWRSRRPCAARHAISNFTLPRYRSSPTSLARAGGEAGGLVRRGTRFPVSHSPATAVRPSLWRGPVAKPAALCGAARDFQFHTPPLPQFAYLFGAGRWRSRRPWFASLGLRGPVAKPTALCGAARDFQFHTPPLPQFAYLFGAGRWRSRRPQRREAERRKPHGRAPH